MDVDEAGAAERLKREREEAEAKSEESAKRIKSAAQAAVEEAAEGLRRNGGEKGAETSEKLVQAVNAALGAGC